MVVKGYEKYYPTTVDGYVFIIAGYQSLSAIHKLETMAYDPQITTIEHHQLLHSLVLSMVVPYHWGLLLAGKGSFLGTLECLQLLGLNKIRFGVVFNHAV